jgi:hypothetical protein
MRLHHSDKARQIDSRARYTDRRFYHHQVIVLPKALSARYLRGNAPKRWAS